MDRINRRQDLNLFESPDTPDSLLDFSYFKKDFKFDPAMFFKYELEEGFSYLTVQTAREPIEVYLTEREASAIAKLFSRQTISTDETTNLTILAQLVTNLEAGRHLNHTYNPYVENPDWDTFVDDDPLVSMLGETLHHRILTPEEEQLLCRRAKYAGDREAEEFLCIHYTRLVVEWARRYQDRGLPLVDLVQEGRVGFIRGLRKFKPDVGTRLSTVAVHWVRQAMQKACIDFGTPVRIPNHSYMQLYKLSSQEVDLRSRNPTVDLNSQEVIDFLAQKLNVTPDRIGELRGYRKFNNSVELNTPVDDDAELGDFFSSPDQVEDHLDEIDLEKPRKILEIALAELTEKQRVVFYLKEIEGLTLKEIGKIYGVSREAIRIQLKRTGRALRIRMEILSKELYGKNLF